MTAATEEEAAEAYDIAAIKFRGACAVTNFEMNRYDVEAIMKSTLPVGGSAKRAKHSPEVSSEHNSLPTSIIHPQQPQYHHHHPNAINANNVGTISFTPIQPALSSSIPCAIPYDSAAAASHHYHPNLFHHFYPSSGSATVDSSVSAAPMTALPASAAAEFFLWPHQPC